MVKVTSFDTDSLTACSYLHTRYGEKINHRYTITRQDLLTARKECKERDVANEKLEKIAQQQSDVVGTREKIFKALGARTKAKLETVPIAKIRKVLTMFQTEHAFNGKVE